MSERTARATQRAAAAHKRKSERAKSGAAKRGSGFPIVAILALVIVGMAYQMPTNMGIIRGGGNTRFPMILDLVSIWAIVLPLSALLAFVFHASPAWVVCCLNADQLFKGVPVFLKVNFGSWARRLTRDPVPAAGLPENG